MLRAGASAPGLQVDSPTSPGPQARGRKVSKGLNGPMDAGVGSMAPQPLLVLITCKNTAGGVRRRERAARDRRTRGASTVRCAVMNDQMGRRHTEVPLPWCNTVAQDA